MQCKCQLAMCWCLVAALVVYLCNVSIKNSFISASLLLCSLDPSNLQGGFLISMSNRNSCHYLIIGLFFFHAFFYKHWTNSMTIGSNKVCKMYPNHKHMTLYSKIPFYSLECIFKTVCLNALLRHARGEPWELGFVCCRLIRNSPPLSLLRLEWLDN